jgi:guanylate kinase
MPAVILYGPPAAGKDAVTKALAELDTKYVLYQRLKVGAGRTSGYRMATLSDVETRRAKDDVIWENRRYGALYVVERTSLTKMLRTCIPVLHLGQVEAVKAVTAALPRTQWLVVCLWCPRDVAIKRLAERDATDIAVRMRAWDDTEPLPGADISLNTTDICPAAAATTIHEGIQPSPPNEREVREFGSRRGLARVRPVAEGLLGDVDTVRGTWRWCEGHAGGPGADLADRPPEPK